MSPSLDQALETGNVVGRVISELESLSVANQSCTKALKDVIPALCNLVLRQLDYASSQILLRDDIAYSENGDFSFVAVASEMKIGIWACQNKLGKGQYTFDLSEMMMSMMLPQSLCHNAIRVIVSPLLDFMSNAQFSLGICYENGEGVEKDNDKFDVRYLKGLEGAREVPLN